MPSDDFDEFHFLADQAREIGHTGPLPHVERLTAPVADGRVISALRHTPTADPDAPVEVVLLHGAGLNAHTWDTTLLALGTPALALDLPGHGDSSWRQDAVYTAETIAPDVVTALRAWITRPVLLVGQSLGGLVAAAVARLAPDLVHELVVVDITPGIDPNGDARQIAAFFAGPTDWASRDELVARALSFGLGGSEAAAARGVWLNSRVRPDGRVEWKHHFAHLAAQADRAEAAGAEAASADGGAPRGEADARQAALRAVLSDRGWKDLAAVRVPVTLVRGERGFVTPAEAQDFVRRLPAASVTVVPASHNVQEDIPVQLAALLRRPARRSS